MIEVAKSILFALLALVGMALICAFCVYIYPNLPLVLALLTLAEAALCGFLALGLFGITWQALSGNPDISAKDIISVKDIWGFGGLAVLALILIYVFNEFMLYLASAWRIDLDRASKDILSLPGTVVQYVVEFFSKLIEALTGVTFASAPSAPRPPPMASGGTATRAILAWLGASIWNVALGVISGILTVLLLRNR